MQEPSMNRVTAIALLCILCFTNCARQPDAFDLVIVGGRVIDPETGLDAVRNIGISGDRIARVTADTILGSRVIDARGLVVAPGFIDLHQHQHDAESYRLKSLDGVTMALELEAGVPDLNRFMEVRRGTTPIHFGASASHQAARFQAWGLPLVASGFGPEASIVATAGLATNEPATVERLEALLASLRRQLDAGALGIGLGLEYTPGATRQEVIAVFRLAAQERRPVFVHVRGAGRLEPGSSIESITEVAGATAITGAVAHIMHVNSTCMRDASECMNMINGLRARGLDVTADAYPYGAGMTFIQSAFFNPGWAEKRGIDFSDIEIPGTGERLTRGRFESLRRSATPQLVVIHLNPDAVVDSVVCSPGVIIASDGLRPHPRNAGTFSRVLARYVREQHTLSMLDAVRKLSLLPAQRLEAATQAALRKGRVQEGADADIVIFDAARITDKSTFDSPAAPSEGVRYLIVSGTLVVNNGVFVDGMYPGRPFLADRGKEEGH